MFALDGIESRKHCKMSVKISYLCGIYLVQDFVIIERNRQQKRMGNSNILRYLV